MLEAGNNSELPPIPGKRYFTIGEVSDLCGVKPHVLRYWEQEFPQLKPVKRRGNRRYYQRQDVIVIRQIRSLLYEQGFTIGGARNKLGGDEARTDISQSQQIVRQERLELEKVLRILRRLTILGYRVPGGASRSLEAHLHWAERGPGCNPGAPTDSAPAGSPHCPR